MDFDPNSFALSCALLSQNKAGKVTAAMLFAWKPNNREQAMDLLVLANSLPYAKIFPTPQSSSSSSCSYENSSIQPSSLIKSKGEIWFIEAKESFPTERELEAWGKRAQKAILNDCKAQGNSEDDEDFTDADNMNFVDLTQEEDEDKEFDDDEVVYFCEDLQEEGGDGGEERCGEDNFDKQNELSRLDFLDDGEKTEEEDTYSHPSLLPPPTSLAIPDTDKGTEHSFSVPPTTMNMNTMTTSTSSSMQSMSSRLAITSHDAPSLALSIFQQLTPGRQAALLFLALSNEDKGEFENLTNLTTRKRPRSPPSTGKPF